MLMKIVTGIGLFFFVVAAVLIIRDVHHIGVDTLGRLVAETSAWVIGLAVLLTVADYGALIGYDVLALRYLGKEVPLRTVATAAGIGFAVSNTAGHAYLAGGSIRYLFYVPAGLTKAQVLILIAFESLTLLMGMALAYVIAVGLIPAEPVLHGYTSLKWLYLSAVGVVAVSCIYLWAVVGRKRRLNIGGQVMTAPSKRMTVAQFGVGLIDNILVFLCFYVLLRFHVEAPVVLSFVVFIVAQTVGLTSQVPGGIGVFEGLFLTLFPHTPEQRGAVLAALITFRVLYFFVPFGAASLYLGMRRLGRVRVVPSGRLK